MKRKELQEQVPELLRQAHAMAMRLVDQSVVPDMAEDIAQEAVLLLLQRAEQHAFADKEEILRYLTVTMHRRLMSAYRQAKHAREAELRSVQEGESAEKLFRDEELRRFVEHALQTLSSRDRELIQMMYLENRSLREVAAQTGMKEVTARKALSRARARLGKVFSETGELRAIGYPVRASRGLSLVVDADVDPGLLSQFLAELAGLYAELSGGDELVIREGKIPVQQVVRT